MLLSSLPWFKKYTIQYTSCTKVKVLQWQQITYITWNTTFRTDNITVSAYFIKEMMLTTFYPYVIYNGLDVSWSLLFLASYLFNKKRHFETLLLLCHTGLTKYKRTIKLWTLRVLKFFTSCTPLLNRLKNEFYV